MHTPYLNDTTLPKILWEPKNLYNTNNQTDYYSNSYQDFVEEQRKTNNYLIQSNRQFSQNFNIQSQVLTDLTRRTKALFDVLDEHNRVNDIRLHKLFAKLKVQISEKEDDHDIVLEKYFTERINELINIIEKKRQLNEKIIIQQINELRNQLIDKSTDQKELNIYLSSKFDGLKM